MFTKIEHWLTLGNQYIAAAVVYLGLSLILSGTTLLDSLQAQATEEEPCSYTVNEMREGMQVLAFIT